MIFTTVKEINELGVVIGPKQTFVDHVKYIFPDFISRFAKVAEQFKWKFFFIMLSRFRCSGHLIYFLSSFSLGLELLGFAHKFKWSETTTFSGNKEAYWNLR